MDEQLELAERIKVSIKIGESHFREFKSALEQGPEGENPRAVRKISKDIAETLVAFANADGGELFVGIEDDGRTSGVPHNDEHIEKMLKAPFTNIHSETPLPTPRVLKIPIGGKGKAAGRNILYFTVPKGTEYVYLTSDGRCLQRHDRETRPVPAERIQYDRQERLSREYDRSFIDGADIGQLDPELLNRVTQKINPSLSPEKMLQFLDLAEWQPLGLSMRRAALLLFAKDINRWHPRSQVRVVKIAGNEIGVGKEFNVIRDDVVSDNIINILARTWDVIRPHLAITRLGTHAVFQETLIYPEEACMEALINALAHRDYSI